MKSDGAITLSIDNTEPHDLKNLIPHFVKTLFMIHEARGFEQFVLDKSHTAEKHHFKTISNRCIFWTFQMVPIL